MGGVVREDLCVLKGCRNGRSRASEDELFIK